MMMMTMLVKIPTVRTFTDLTGRARERNRSSILVYDAETDDESEKQPANLADFFQDHHFYVFDDEFDENTFHDIRRIIYAYNGTLEKQISADVQYVITNQPWNDNFNEVRVRKNSILLLYLKSICRRSNRIPIWSFSLSNGCKIATMKTNSFRQNRISFIQKKTNEPVFKRFLLSFHTDLDSLGLWKMNIHYL